MSEKIRQFIDQLASGSNSEAKETLENELASRAFSSLDEYKKELAGSIFGGNQEQEQEELAMEEETEQLDELSNKTIQSYHTKATGIRKGGGNVDDKMQDHSYAASDAHDAGKKSLARYHDKKFNDLNDRYRKRGSGIDRAEKRLKINIPKV